MVSQNDKDRVTKLMGENLLKGYTLLDEYCLVCPTPLMKRKNEEPFCVYCRDVKKKDSSKEAKMQVDTPIPMIQSTTGKATESSTKQAGIKLSLHSVVESTSLKLVWLSDSLQKCTDLSECLQLNQTMQSTMDTLEKAHKLLQSQ